MIRKDVWTLEHVYSVSERQWVRHRLSLLCCSHSKDPLLRICMRTKGKTAVLVITVWTNRGQINWDLLQRQIGLQSWRLPEDSDPLVSFGLIFAFLQWPMVFISSFYPLASCCIHLFPPMWETICCSSWGVSLILGHSSTRTFQSSSWDKVLDHDML